MKRGFTIMEIMIIIAIISIIAAFAIPIIAGLELEPCSKEKVMKHHIKILHPEIKGVRVMCSNDDSDHNGYYRCTATGISPKTKLRETIVAECNCDSCAPILGIDR